ncbi:hypothetical protein ANN_01554 [Periplaneta americana]|uniref:Uncharacterized protein n=1 Tax=Periplaneta americana TaxID=6978 RepID=A0ABQ8TTW3_PERAM|nr:hypothetical protein ANN_01554 [Periplaneta americana]
MKLDHEGNQNVAGPYEVDVEHSTVDCGGSELVHIETTVRSPPTRPQPGEGYELLLGLGLYKFHKDLDTWYNAEQTCVKEGAHLLVLNSDNEFAVLKKKWNDSGVGGTYLHAGINDFDKEATFVTITEMRFYSTIYNMCILLLLGLFCWRFEVSAAGQCTLPSITPLKVTTVSLRNDTGHWIATVKMDHDANQDVAGPFEVDLEHSIEKCTDSESVHIETTVRAPPTQAQRGNGYELLPGLGLYKFHKAADTWYNAEMTCVKEGAHLLVLNSENEFAIIKKKWDEYAVGGRYLQIGINDFDAEKTFVTVTGK